MNPTELSSLENWPENMSKTTRNTTKNCIKRSIPQISVHKFKLLLSSQNCIFHFLGSRDGWAPKNFKSSRENRIKESNDKGQKPEDFMDDEDMGDFGIAPQKIQNAAKFRKEKDDLGKVIYHKYYK